MLPASHSAGRSRRQITGSVLCTSSGQRCCIAGWVCVCVRSTRGDVRSPLIPNKHGPITADDHDDAFAGESFSRFSPHIPASCARNKCGVQHGMVPHTFGNHVPGGDEIAGILCNILLSMDLSQYWRRAISARGGLKRLAIAGVLESCSLISTRYPHFPTTMPVTGRVVEPISHHIWTFVGLPGRIESIGPTENRSTSLSLSECFLHAIDEIHVHNYVHA
jgi:hypothetical protein